MAMGVNFILHQVVKDGVLFKSRGNKEGKLS